MDVRQLALAAGIALCSATSTANAQGFVHILSVGQHSDVGEVDLVALESAFRGASNLFKTVDSPNDSACNLSLQPDGPIGTFSVGSAWVDGDDQYREIVNNSGYNINIVESITNCSGETGWYGGCGGGGGLILARESAGDGTLLAHIFGHTLRLGHQDINENFMSPWAGEERRDVTPLQCETLKWGPAARADTESYAAPSPAAAIATPPIEQLAAHGFMDTMPTDLADRYSADDAAILLDILADADQAALHTNALVLLGLIGDGGATETQTVIEHVEQASSNALRVAGGIALGYALQRNFNADALQYLIQRATQEADQLAADGAIVGLGLSGLADARDALLQWQSSARNAHQQKLLTRALDDSFAVESLGLRGYYRASAEAKE